MRKKYAEYSQKIILTRMNPEYIGISKSYSSSKKDRVAAESLRKEYDHQVSYMKKINEKLEKSISKKKKELNYVQGVRNRYVSQMLKKQLVEEVRSKQLNERKNKAFENRTLSQSKIMEAKEKMSREKKFDGQNLRTQIRNLITAKRQRQSTIWQYNKSRVKKIEEQKARIAQDCNRFYQTRNKKCMQQIKKSISKEENSTEREMKEMKKLERKLLQLNNEAKQRRNSIQKINESIYTEKQRLNESRQSRRKSSASSLTPSKLGKSSTTKVDRTNQTIDHHDQNFEGI